MTDRDALIRAICTDPADDTVRLILADWLGENGEPERAEFIRVQCALSRSDPFTTMPHWREREQKLFDRFRCEWFGDRWAILNIDQDDTDNYPDLLNAVVRRGFVDEVRLPLSVFLGHAESLFRQHPITRVVLTDREPMESRRRVRGHDSSWAAPEYVSTYEWHRSTIEACRTGEPDYLPEIVFDKLPGHRPQYTLHPSLTVPLSMRYDTAEAAGAALSAACVNYGRERAGLPPLEVVRV